MSVCSGECPSVEPAKLLEGSSSWGRTDRDRATRAPAAFLDANNNNSNKEERAKHGIWRTWGRQRERWFSAPSLPLVFTGLAVMKDKPSLHMFSVSHRSCLIFIAFIFQLYSSMWQVCICRMINHPEPGSVGPINHQYVFIFYRLVCSGVLLGMTFSFK